MEATIIKKDGKATLDKPFEFMVPMYRGLFQGIHRRGILEHR